MIESINRNGDRATFAYDALNRLRRRLTFSKRPVTKAALAPPEVEGATARVSIA